MSGETASMICFRSFQRRSSTRANCPFPHVTLSKRNWTSASLRAGASKGASRRNNISRTWVSVRGSPPSPASTQKIVAGASLRHSNERGPGSTAS